jgi:hypothetical protein
VCLRKLLESKDCAVRAALVGPGEAPGDVPHSRWDVDS